MFKVLGKFVAKALLDFRILDLPLNNVFLTWILKQESSLTAKNIAVIFFFLFFSFFLFFLILILILILILFFLILIFMKDIEPTLANTIFDLEALCTEKRKILDDKSLVFLHFFSPPLSSN